MVIPRAKRYQAKVVVALRKLRYSLRRSLFSFGRFAKLPGKFITELPPRISQMMSYYAPWLYFNRSDNIAGTV